MIAERYVLEDVMGEGGMGIVYRARQLRPVKRTVALKLIRAGLNSKNAVGRFDAERQALALMDHPNIAKVHDGGMTESGELYFVMEFVDGAPLTSYCDRKSLSIDARLRLFVDICAAVQHAHQKGIIHRDLKPGNILVTEVDGRPTPKVIDFGVAKATEVQLTDMSFSDTGAVVGTPLYMSPEQAEPSSLDVDTRSDVFSLGVILYELLVGSTPIESKDFKRGAYYEMLRMVREVEPPKPSTKLRNSERRPNIAASRSVEPVSLEKSLEGELDWVVMKALEKDRERRYPTANGLARDIQRYLDDEPVEARPPSRGYRIRKFIRRNRSQVIAAGLLFITLIAGVVGTSLGWREARQQADFARKGWDQSDANFKSARELGFRLAEEITRIESSERDPRALDNARQKVLTDAINTFEQFRAMLPDDLVIQNNAALLQRYLARVRRNLGNLAGAEQAYDNSIRIYRKLVQEHPENDKLRYSLALALSDQAMTDYRTAKETRARALLDEARSIASAEPVKAQLSDHLRVNGQLEDNSSLVALILGDFDGALIHSEKAIDHQRQLDKLPEAARHAFDPVLLAVALGNQGEILRELGRIKEALQVHDQSVVPIAKIDINRASRDDLYFNADIRRQRAVTIEQVPERIPAAIDDLVQVIQFSEKLTSDFPKTPHFQELLASALLQRGILLTKQGQIEPGKSELDRSLAASRILLDKFQAYPHHMLVRGNTFIALSENRKKAGQVPEAIQFAKNAVTVFTLAIKSDPVNFHLKRGLAQSEQALKELTAKDVKTPEIKGR